MLKVVSKVLSKNVLTVMTGSVIAQLIPIILTPVLTRIYTPKQFGTYGFLFAVIVMLAIVATGR
jgi:O-antigen/teichoic acid export membrane protein